MLYGARFFWIAASTCAKLCCGIAGACGEN
jgi:hypothetical protein